MEERPLLVTADEELLDDVLRLAAAAGVPVQCTPEVPGRTQWRSAPVVLVDGARLTTVVAAGLPRRARVVVVSAGEPDAAMWQACVQIGADRVLRADHDEEELVALLAESARPVLHRGNAVAVIGARGGAGASVLAAAVAVAGARSGSAVVLADADPWGPGLDVLMGLETGSGLHWEDLAAPAGRVRPEELHRGLPGVDLGGTTVRRGWRRPIAGIGAGHLSVLCRGRDGSQDRRLGVHGADVVDVVIESCRAAGELVVIDLPRAPDPAADRAVELADLLVVVAMADVPSCYAGRRMLDRLSPLAPNAGLVVRGPSPSGVGADDVAAVLGLPLIATMRPQFGLGQGVDDGVPPGLARGPLSDAARAVLARLPSAQSGVEP